MQIVFETRKDLPCEGLHDLFKAVGRNIGSIPRTN